ncbi:ABA4-like family protein [Erythrobacter sp. HA6-11]
MSWDTVFSIANMYALICWVALAFLPRWPALLAAILYAGVGLLCLTYAVSLIGLMSGTLDPGGGVSGGNFSSIEGVRTLFSSDAGITIGWVHYLAFDLFVGIWIARDADAKGFGRIIQVPVLIATLMAGPLGLFIWLLLREKRAREQGRFT